MPHMIAAEHQGQVNALLYDTGAGRSQATIQAAITAIGASLAVLVLTKTGDGVWTVTSNMTSNSNITLLIPQGVTVNIASGVTWGHGGAIIAHNAGWKTGPGTFSKSAVAPLMEFSHLSCTAFNQSTSASGVVWSLNGGSGNNRAIQMHMDQGGNACGLTISRDVSNTTFTWQLLATDTGTFTLARPAAGPVLLAGTAGVMVGANVAPAHVLQMGVDDAFKATASWSTPSDSRLKNVEGTYTDGLALLLALPAPIRFTWNGKGNTPVDSPEQVGMIAQEVEPVAPYLLKTYQDYLEPTDPTPTTLYSLNDSPLIYTVINALREVDQRLQVLEGLATGSGTPRLDSLEAAAHTHGGGGSAAGVQPYTPPPPPGLEATTAQDAPAALHEHERSTTPRRRCRRGQ